MAMIATGEIQRRQLVSLLHDEIEEIAIHKRIGARVPGHIQ
jgi:hypothetical protein